VPVQAKITFASSAHYFTSPFPHSGPLPPKVDTETVYAVEWVVGASRSDIRDDVVTATLPPNVRFRNVRTPVAEDLVFDEKTRTVTWYVGGIASGDSSGQNGGKKVTFAIGLIPSASQIRDHPEIITNQRFAGTDSYTHLDFATEADDLDTVLTEEGFAEHFAPVVE
jgi:hypothetical protein